ncbi:hypothetical protein SAMN05192559_10997 [Halobacillus karajensis]|uniref:Uncharacterized protein n=2 Tax=Halobacillus karajensis TaxID=195088 RepID=A0A024P8P5_9BACI|nr:hypothetical protein [Halobacillus karajensis]CDQ18343.1 hypothetical protein BN982_00604 [Halobacillus karajensis]CDQ24697.1 hypothetical protein BN983_02992 [Halobacillus karajensis]CDQ29057.1 hypothetical protein BN981_03417 [Halobacillus karajensis]SEI06649.1 hypothetical protein SAMN05192559_10997 [Halobacillus karajensis]
MKLFAKMMEVSVIAVFSVLFAGYALFIYPFEKLAEMMSAEVKEKKLKYTPATEKTVA